jgi:hypothetical protein
MSMHYLNSWNALVIKSGTHDSGRSVLGDKSYLYDLRCVKPAGEPCVDCIDLSKPGTQTEHQFAE